jgi:hypothetical protein
MINLSSNPNCDHTDRLFEIVSDTSNPKIFEMECPDCGYREEGIMVVTDNEDVYFIPFDKVRELEGKMDELEFI